jgi:unsaturated chondroitin disaccharide hydrolase
LLLAGIVLFASAQLRAAEPMPALIDADRISHAVQHAGTKLAATVAWLEATCPGEYGRHVTRTDSTNTVWSTTASVDHWTYGYFPATLWRMRDILEDPASKTYYYEKAVLFCEGVKAVANRTSDLHGDYNNAFRALESAYIATGEASWKDAILDCTRTKDDYYNDTCAIYGYWRSTTYGAVTETYWHAFADHIPDVAMVFWAARNTGDPTEQLTWRAHALQHARSVGANFVDPMLYSGSGNRDGSCQRAYFDYYQDETGTGFFLFPEKKQGWDHDTTWTRGQSWVVYGLAEAYAATLDGVVLRHAKTAVDYLINHLPAQKAADAGRVEGDCIPHFDYDYPDPIWAGPSGEYAHLRDTSAGSIAASAIFRLVRAMPETDADRLRYWGVGCSILEDLCSCPAFPSEYQHNLTDGTDNPAILQHGCGDHWVSGGNDNGLIWGDYYFIDAVAVYLSMTPGSPRLLRIEVTPGTAGVEVGTAQQFMAVGRDQYGDVFALQSPLVWSVSGGGTISGTGLFTGGSIPGGLHTVTAEADGVTGTAGVEVWEPSENAGCSPGAGRGGPGDLAGWLVPLVALGSACRRRGLNRQVSPSRQAPGPRGEGRGWPGRATDSAGVPET